MRGRGARVGRMSHERACRSMVWLMYANEKIGSIAPMVAKRRARIAMECRWRVIQDIGCGEATSERSCGDDIELTQYRQEPKIPAQASSHREDVFFGSHF